MKPRKYIYDFRFFDTMEQAEHFRMGLLEMFKANKYYMRTYKNRITLNKVTKKDGTYKFILHYYY